MLKTVSTLLNWLNLDNLNLNFSNMNWQRHNESRTGLPMPEFFLSFCYLVNLFTKRPNITLSQLLLGWPGKIFSGFLNFDF